MPVSSHWTGSQPGFTQDNWEKHCRASGKTTLKTLFPRKETCSQWDLKLLMLEKVCTGPRWVETRTMSIDGKADITVSCWAEVVRGIKVVHLLNEESIL